MVALSSCLIGKKCRYNGTDSLDLSLLDRIDDEFIDLCPELLGGFKTPRLPCEIVSGTAKDVLAGTAKIIDARGNDITSAMMSGAIKAMNLCKSYGVTKAYLKQNSPSCGRGEIYDGSFAVRLIKGNGIFAELLLANGIDVIAIA